MGSSLRSLGWEGGTNGPNETNGPMERWDQWTHGTNETNGTMGPMRRMRRMSPIGPIGPIVPFVPFRSRNLEETLPSNLVGTLARSHRSHRAGRAAEGRGLQPRGCRLSAPAHAACACSFARTGRWLPPRPTSHRALRRADEAEPARVHRGAGRNPTRPHARAALRREPQGDDARADGQTPTNRRATAAAPTRPRWTPAAGRPPAADSSVPITTERPGGRAESALTPLPTPSRSASP